MNTKTVMGLLVSALVTNFAIGACSGPESSAQAGPGAGGSSATSGSGSTGTGACACEVPKPESVTEFCTHHFVNEMAGAEAWYAEHLYPGASLEELALVSVVKVDSEPDYAYPSEYVSHIITHRLYLADGKVSVSCTGPSDSVIFVKR